ncbi:TAXI family TRAP transporter solute-binding subunit [Salipiger thiooxidans]|uniref:TAXI family TRAP transporter solute-binding subunit n=1 Tax=Salipiger thiooxidans TaxID=282683 RepID=UPI001CD50417|nr:TAXI family TRAP transporter solute-binding subunit [Salipiger thiooxidans]MCA0850602.1 TAXI family TRAP transporter solute-binding subunit [Salipiger thiooxidans]
MKRRTLFGLSMAALIAGTVASAQDDRADWPGNIVVATASPGGTYAVYGQGVATVISDALGVPASTQQTQGPLQNLVLVHKARVDVGLTTLGPAFEALEGDMELDPGTKYDDVRALFPMYVTPFQAASLQRTGIVKVSDFDGKTVGTGPKGGTGGTYWERWFDVLGLDVTVQNGPIGDQTAQLADGRLDAVATAAGIPMSAFSELEALQPSVIFGFTDDELAKLGDSVPYAQVLEIPAATYSSLDAPVKTLGMWNIAFASKDMSESLAYEITKAIFEQHDALVATHGSAKETLLENVGANTVMPYHPGAVRYFQEQGIKVPDDVLPQE